MSIVININEYSHIIDGVQGPCNAPSDNDTPHAWNREFNTLMRLSQALNARNNPIEPQMELLHVLYGFYTPKKAFIFNSAPDMQDLRKLSQLFRHLMFSVSLQAP